MLSWGLERCGWWLVAWWLDAHDVFGFSDFLVFNHHVDAWLRPIIMKCLYDASYLDKSSTNDKLSDTWQFCNFLCFYGVPS